MKSRFIVRPKKDVHEDVEVTQIRVVDEWGCVTTIFRLPDGRMFNGSGELIKKAKD